MAIDLVPLTLDNFEIIIGDRKIPNLVSKSEFLYHHNLLTSRTFLHRVAAVTSDGQLVGDGLAVTGPWDPTPKAGHFEIRVRVAKEWRNQGIGTGIYQDVSRFATQHGAIALDANVSDACPNCLSFAEHRGFEIVNHTFVSQLNLQQFDASHFSKATSLENRVEIVSLADYPQTDEWFQRFVEFYYELTDEIPGMQGMRPKELDLEKEKDNFMVKEPWDPEAVIIATVDGEWAALCYLTRIPGDGYGNGMTGVKQQYRGQGLGLAVKCAAIEYAQRQGAKFMRTGNASINKPMLAINQKVGFEREGGTLFLTKTLSPHHLRGEIGDQGTAPLRQLIVPSWRPTP